MKSIKEQVKDRIIEEQNRAAQLKVFKYRNADDDGWIFCTGKNRADARKISRTSNDLHAASHGDLESIATRALMLEGR